MKVISHFLPLVFLALLALNRADDGDDDSSGESHEQKQRRDSCGGLVTEPAGTPAPVTTAAPGTPASTGAPGTPASTASAGTPASTDAPGTVPTAVSTTIATPAPGECYCTPLGSSDSTVPEGDDEGDSSDSTPEGGEEGSSVAPGGSAGVTSGNGGSGGSGGSGDFHSSCPLVEAFFNMSLLLTAEEQVIWEEWIQEIENEFLANSSLTNDEKVVAISVSLQLFFSTHVDIYNTLSYSEIADWGYVIDFLYVSISVQIDITESIVTIDSASGSCALIDAITNASLETGSSEEQSACSDLTAEIKSSLEDSSLTYEQKLSAVYEQIESFCSSHADLESWLLSIDIEGYGSLQSFVNVAHTYWRITNLSTVISGSSSSDCVLLAALEEASKNSSFTSEQQEQILQLEQKLQTYFESTTSISARLQYVSQTCYQQFKLESWMVEIVESISCGEWGSIYDIVFCSGVCHNSGCGDLDSQNPSSAAPSTEASSEAPSTESSSEAPSTVKPADCSTVGSLIVINATLNTTILTDTLTEAYNSWNSSTKTGFNSYFNKIRRAIWDDALYPTQTAKLEELHSDFSEYNKNNVAKQQVVFNVSITVWGGTIGDFVTCTASV